MPEPRRPLRVGSLFSGIGGFELGFEQAGMETVWACEADPKARAVYRRHWPQVHIFHDIKRIGRSDLAEFGPVDVLCGGFPCQDLSVAGRRMGLAGSRSGLFWRIMRLIPKLPPPRPRWIVLENVPGLLSSNQGRDMAAVLGALEDRGYGWAYRVLDAQYFGLAQRRKRVFIVGHLGDCQPAGKVLFEPESMRWDSPPRREARTRVAALTSAGVGTCGADDNQAQAGHLIPETAPCLDASFSRLQGCSGQDLKHGHGHLIAFGGNNTQGTIDIATARNAHGGAHGRQDFESETFIAHTLRGEGFDASEDGTGRGAPLVPVSTFSPGDRGVSVDQACAGMIQPVSVCLGSDTITATDMAQPQTGRNGDPGVVAFCMRGREGGAQVEASGEQAMALRASKGGGDKQFVAETMRVRRIMPVEGERLQGFPDGWTEYGLDDTGKMKRIELVGPEQPGAYGAASMADGPRYKMIGNAAPPPVLRWIGERLVAVHWGLAC